MVINEFQSKILIYFPYCLSMHKQYGPHVMELPRTSTLKKYMLCKYTFLLNVYIGDTKQLKIFT